MFVGQGIGLNQGDWLWKRKRDVAALLNEPKGCFACVEASDHIRCIASCFQRLDGMFEAGQIFINADDPQLSSKSFPKGKKSVTAAGSNIEQARALQRRELVSHPCVIAT